MPLAALANPLRYQAVFKALKPVLARTVYRPGSIHSVLWGPSRGLRYRVFGSGLAPIYGGWEPDAQQLMARHIHAGDVVYDLGANRGIHALLFARLVGPAGLVYAFEPVPEFRAELMENVALNGFTNVSGQRYAVSSHSGTQRFFRGHHYGAGHLAETGDQQGQAFEVDTITLDDFAFREGHRPPTFIKVDIEGGEGDALNGARRVLAGARPTLLVDLHTPEQDRVVGGVLAELGYTAYRTRGMERVTDLRRGWPDKNGLWGQIIAFSEA